ncbi:hypothetical protein NC653_033346 [Populus alba x Populus x berolinensis]|uniref:Uncharacterized protein n=1 Tax=Populus alba x Populus x berolinensis TaxID=444605 RepID=A0AAD6PZ06_9ROSI|nr:hypothetical protein NC653_033346 [Populus alba x Populus x berolinensis]
MKLCFKSEGDTEATGNFLQQALLNSPPAIGILNSLQKRIVALPLDRTLSDDVGTICLPATL